MTRKYILAASIFVVAIGAAFFLTACGRSPSSIESGSTAQTGAAGNNKTAAAASSTDKEVQNDLDNAVSEAIKAQGKGYLAGEAAAEGHIILETEDKAGQVKVYTISSFGYFGFENGIFTKISGSGAIPTVMTFKRSPGGGYTLVEYREPMDGAGYTDSIKKMFPQKLWSKVMNEGKPQPEILAQQEAQAAEYLEGIGRKAKVSAAHVQKKLAEINVEASNKLFAGLTKNDRLLNSCPYWLGTREQLEGGIRYIYETSQSKTADGFDLMTFRKMKEDGKIVEERKYKITGSEPQLQQ